MIGQLLQEGVSACGGQRGLLSVAPRAAGMPWSRMPCRIWPFGFEGAAPTAAGAAFALTNTPLHYAWPEALIWDSTQAAFATFTAITIAGQQQIVGTAVNMAAQAFVENAVNNFMNLDCLAPNGPVTITGTNTGAVARTMRCLLMCVVQKNNCGAQWFTRENGYESALPTAA